MGVSYRAVQWTPDKKRYDLVLVLGVLLWLGVFIGVGSATKPQITIETLVIRAFGTCAFFLLHVVLSIGPLARLDARFLPLLYNRRHLGVITFLCALVHGLFSLVQFHALGELHPLTSVLVSNGRYESLAWFPFQPLGLAALSILFLMAATSHDFWLHNLSAPVWKALHMLVYPAYALLVLHVALGALQAERRPVFAILVGLGILWIVGLHLVAGWRESAADVETTKDERASGDAESHWVDVGPVSEIPESRARIVLLGGERVAIFRWQGRVAAVSNVCQHQNGPLGEGRIVDGCIVCPWHGYQYRPEDGCSPPPFSERIPTFRVRVHRSPDGVAWIQVDPRPLPPGTAVEPAHIPDSPPAGSDGERA